ncbi:AraC family transcriptional regulator [Sphingopyxis sp. JAI128]|uniref:helix-turn-helix transcriptional regulator n=1 Tax=Sphingopyxis sp. JAI128 TaxID=2723066 RepID=UPI00178DAD82|nr:AraC family transcriptional regulator [Sphingopyxis sp. JAI128]MBB6426078.1 AraC family transcriptional regulator [Sphingopyxis sp. JAI128]
MNEAATIWDGIRPRSPRDVVARHQAQIGRLGVLAATENLASPTDWAFEEAHHVVVLHLGGRLDRMDCEFSVGPSGPAMPARGDIWMIPAACRYAALAQGERAEFVELSVPTALLADAPLAARVKHRDEFLFRAGARLAGLVRGPDDDLARMAAHEAGDAIERHLRTHYGYRERGARHRALSASERNRLADAVRGQLDAEHSLAALAALVGMEVRRFTDAFHDAFGLSPWQYVMRARLDEAARRLWHGAEPVTEVALATGFASPSHFATAFARRFGVPPSRYRAAAR